MQLRVQQARVRVENGSVIDREGWHQRSRSRDQLGRALPVSIRGETNDATRLPNSSESRSMLQQD